MQDHNNYNQPAGDIILRDRLPDHMMPDMPSRRWRYWVFALVAFVLAVSLYLLINTSQMAARFQVKLASVEDSDTLRIRQYNQKLEELQDRMTVFVADSVETKIKTLEKNVADGSVGSQEIKILEDIKGEVKLLEKYSSGRGGRLTDSSRLDHPRFQITPGTQSTTSGGDLLYEVSQMKRLLYLSIASCGFVGFLIGGYWWQSNFRNKRIFRDIPPPRLLVRKKGDD